MDDIETVLLRKHGLVREFPRRESLIVAIQARELTRFWIAKSNGTVPVGYMGPFEITLVVESTDFDRVQLLTQTVDGEELFFVFDEVQKFAAQCIASTCEQAADYHLKARAAYNYDVEWQLHAMVSARENTALTVHYE